MGPPRPFPQHHDHHHRCIPLIRLSLPLSSPPPPLSLSLSPTAAAENPGPWDGQLVDKDRDRRSRRVRANLFGSVSCEPRHVHCVCSNPCFAPVRLRHNFSETSSILASRSRSPSSRCSKPNQQNWFTLAAGWLQGGYRQRPRVPTQTPGRLAGLPVSLEPLGAGQDAILTSHVFSAALGPRRRWQGRGARYVQQLRERGLVESFLDFCL